MRQVQVSRSPEPAREPSESPGQSEIEQTRIGLFEKSVEEYIARTCPSFSVSDAYYNIRGCRTQIQGLRTEPRDEGAACDRNDRLAVREGDRRPGVDRRRDPGCVDLESPRPPSAGEFAPHPGYSPVCRGQMGAGREQ